MKLYVLRHGHSLSASEAGVASDAERPLSDQGKADVRRITQIAAEKGAAPAVLLTSPLRRAVETGAEAAKVLRPKLGTRIFEPLSNRISGNELFEALQKDTAADPSLKGLEELLIIGHQPQLGDLVAHLTGAVVEIRPGGLVALEISPEKASLLWRQIP